MIEYIWTVLITASYFWVTTSSATTDFTLCFEEYCYMQSETKMNFAHAVDYCLERDAVLASIHSSKQNAYINDHVRKSSKHLLWIGATDVGEEGVWRWLDGTEFNYQNWGTGGPDNSGGREHNAAIWNSDGRWNDIPGSISSHRSRLPLNALCMRAVTSTKPTMLPSVQPTLSPSDPPTFPPTADPTRQPTAKPTMLPSGQPTISPADPPTLPTSTSKQPTLPLIPAGLLDVILISLNIITICILCGWVLPRARRNGSSKSTSEKLLLNLEGETIGPHIEGHEDFITMMKLSRVKNDQSEGTMEVRLQDMDSPV